MWTLYTSGQKHVDNNNLKDQKQPQRRTDVQQLLQPTSNVNGTKLAIGRESIRVRPHA